MRFYICYLWPCMGKRTLTTFRFWAGFHLQPFVNHCIRSNNLVTRSLETPTCSNDLVTRSLETPTRSNDLVTRSTWNTNSFKRLGHLFTRNTNSFEWLDYFLFHVFTSVVRDHFLCFINIVAFFDCGILLYLCLKPYNVVAITTAGRNFQMINSRVVLPFWRHVCFTRKNWTLWLV